MRPGAILHNVGNGSSGVPQKDSNFRHGVIVGHASNKKYPFVCQDSISVGYPMRMTILIYGIQFVVPLGPQPMVSIIATYWPIAAMANTQPNRNRTMHQRPCDTISRETLTPRPMTTRKNRSFQFAVWAKRSCPIPAVSQRRVIGMNRAVLINLRPKAGNILFRKKRKELSQNNLRNYWTPFVGNAAVGTESQSSGATLAAHNYFTIFPIHKQERVTLWPVC